jgi:dicarboxylate transporter 10
MLNVLYRFAARDGEFAVLHKIFSADHAGIPSLWTGLSASILRQGTYSTARFGFHTYFSDKLLNYTGAKKLSVTQNIACAGVAGGVAGLVGNPAEVILVRMCADGAKAPAQQFQYSNAIDALARVYRDEGMGAFWKGLTPNIARSVLMSKYGFWP